ncbi:hypothetical protein NAP1_08837 [Erythrobacter sp. NAP1]|uniref:hypothetical protein n=1 Tax=Erythrobacter sp. NAP1 TaxID=237727 RepID=UPI0000685168|nr:hypothetical protein [Erythrobacter sp. NAP1]EAQ27686.1 hypothetical protein NAP1_08837 [Erythrobacter sp. NAP1]
MPEDQSITTANIDEQVEFLDAWYRETAGGAERERRAALVARLVKQIDAALETLAELAPRPS